MLNGNDVSQSSTNSTTQELPVADYSSATTATTTTTEDFDATAAALSRLSVLTEHSRAEGTASPQLNSDSTYETAIIRSCPSPSKRTSEYFDRSHDESDLKRLRRESMKKPAFIDVSCPFTPAFSVSNCALSGTEDVLSGLGIERIRAKSPSLPESAFGTATNRASSGIPTRVEQQTSCCASKSDVASSRANLPYGRRRSRSLPATPVTRWYDSHRSNKHRHKVHEPVSYFTSPFEALLHREKDLKHIPLPPVTQQTLRELELSEIFKNAQLRHDIVHDPNLQFRPNTDGERGAKKRRESIKYWRSIVRELEGVQNMPRTMLAGTRLSVMFREMKCILLSLVPASEKTQVEATFDHELFMQTLNHGLFSPMAFAQYMSTLLKRHCAPMRDEAIDRTVRRIGKATTPVHFAESLRSTFEVLEMMKLDVANHQLRTLRGYLLDTSVEFEKNWFKRKFDTGVYPTEPSAAWCKSLQGMPGLGEPVNDLRARFVHGFTSFFKSSNSIQVPATFTFDQCRITTLHKDIQELLFLNLVVLLAKQLDKEMKSDDFAVLKSEIWALLSAETCSILDNWGASIPSFALHLASRSLGTATHGMSLLPDSTSTKFATSWMETHMSPKSAIFQMMQARLLALLDVLVYGELTASTYNGQKVTPTPQWGAFESCRFEVQNIATRIAAVASYHWKIHGATYVVWSQQ